MSIPRKPKDVDEEDEGSSVPMPRVRYEEDGDDVYDIEPVVLPRRNQNGDGDGDEEGCSRPVPRI